VYQPERELSKFQTNVSIYILYASAFSTLSQVENIFIVCLRKAILRRIEKVLMPAAPRSRHKLSFKRLPKR